MPRIILKDEKEPYKLQVGDKTVWICMCGLSKNQPFCDGSHKATQREDPDKVYIYDEDLEREEIDFLAEYFLDEEDDDEDFDDEEDYEDFEDDYDEEDHGEDDKSIE